MKTLRNIGDVILVIIGFPILLLLCLIIGAGYLVFIFGFAIILLIASIADAIRRFSVGMTEKIRSKNGNINNYK